MRIASALFLCTFLQDHPQPGMDHPAEAVIHAAAGREGMISMDQAILTLYQEGNISLDTAMHYADKPEQMRRLIL